MNRIHFVSFGGPSDNYHQALKRLHRQAIDFNVFSSFFVYTERELKEDTEFWKKHGNFILSNPRGFGYWIWKPHLILKSLRQIETNDILIYMDAGCEINPYGKPRFFELINLVSTKEKIIGTHSISNDLSYTKKDVSSQFPLSDNSLSQNQVQAGYLILRKCPEILSLIEQWKIICESDYHNIDDTPSILPNHPSFIEHRHDQSILNLLLKQYGLINYLAEPADIRIENPIWYCRNRSGNQESLNIIPPY